MRLAIDASDIQAGGGLTHLLEILLAVDPCLYEISQVTVWANQQILDKLPQRPWITPSCDPLLNSNLIKRILWKQVRLPNLLRQNFDVLFVPSGNYYGSFRPFVTMSHNLLPFDLREMRRFGASSALARYQILRITQSSTFKRADGIIFLTDTAQRAVTTVTGELSGKVVTIPHGIAKQFSCKPRNQRAISDYTLDKPFRWLYVSIINLYKHQWRVVEAVAKLRNSGLPIALDLVGPAYEPAMAHLHAAMQKVDPKGEFVTYHGPISYKSLAEKYHSADGFIFASSCENMPNILIEAMASGLPIACSDRGPMPEILGDAGVYFDPEKHESIADALQKLLSDSVTREEYAWKAYRQAQQYSWERCASETFSFLAQFAKQNEYLLRS